MRAEYEGRVRIAALPRKRLKMAKGRSKGSAKDKGRKSSPAESEAKLPSGVRKQVRRLERELAAAARKEIKRVRKLERARHRRQMAEASLVELRTAVLGKASAAPKRPTAATDAAPKPAAPKPAPKPTSRAARPATTTRRTAPKTPATKPAPPSEPKP